MKSATKYGRRNAVVFIAVALVLLCPLEAGAQVVMNPIDDVMRHLHDATSKWRGPLAAYGLGLFWTLFTIEFIYRSIELLVAGKGLWAINTFLWMRVIYVAFWGSILINAEKLVLLIPESVMEMGRGAGVDHSMEPQTIFAQGLDMVGDLMGTLALSDPIGSLGTLLASFVIVAGFFTLAALYALAWVKVWFIASAGIFMLGFAGASWTRGLAEGYLKALLAASVKLLVVGLIVQASEDTLRGMGVTAVGAGSPDEIERLLAMGLSVFFIAMLAKGVPDAVGAMVAGAHSGSSEMSIMGLPAAVGGAVGGAVGSFARDTASVAQGVRQLQAGRNNSPPPTTPGTPGPPPGAPPTTGPGARGNGTSAVPSPAGGSPISAERPSRGQQARIDSAAVPPMPSAGGGGGTVSGSGAAGPGAPGTSGRSPASPRPGATPGGAAPAPGPSEGPTRAAGGAPASPGPVSGTTAGAGTEVPTSNNGGENSGR